VPELPDEVRLDGDRFRLRRLLPADADGLHELRADPEVRRWSDPRELTIDEARAEVDAARAAWSEGSSALLAISALDESFLGTIGLHWYGAKRASVGYDLVPSARGRGIATDAVRLLASWAFERFPELVRLELWTAVGNEASERVAERAGFQREGVFRSRLPFGGELRDVTVFSRLRGEDL
jgi:RimJ/RimL family protein N-acetyltransferase